MFYIMEKEKYNTKTKNTTNVRRELYCKYWERFNIKQLVTVNNNGIYIIIHTLGRCRLAAAGCGAGSSD